MATRPAGKIIAVSGIEKFIRLYKKRQDIAKVSISFLSVKRWFIKYKKY